MQPIHVIITATLVLGLASGCGHKKKKTENGDPPAAAPTEENGDQANEDAQAGDTELNQGDLVLCKAGDGSLTVKDKASASQAELDDQTCEEVSCDLVDKDLSIDEYAKQQQTGTASDTMTTESNDEASGLEGDAANDSPVFQEADGPNGKKWICQAKKPDNAQDPKKDETKKDPPPKDDPLIDIKVGGISAKL